MQDTGRRRRSRLEFGHEVWNFRIRQRWMMPHPPSPITLRQNLVEVSTPTRRVFTASLAERFRRVENRFNSSADTVCRFRLLEPNGLQYAHDHRRVDIAHIDLAENRIGVRGERVPTADRVSCFSNYLCGGQCSPPRPG